MGGLDYADIHVATQKGCERIAVTEITATIDTKLIITGAILKSTKMDAR